MGKLPNMPQTRDLLAYRIVSTPNGKSYGKDGHVPSDHVVVFEHSDCTRSFDGREWRVVEDKRAGAGG